MVNVLGLIGFVLYCICVVAIAAAITWVVVKISPKKKPAEEPSTSQ
jgi:hypothetical protein